MAEVAAEPATYRDVFAVGEFRVLWLAQLLSVAGDQLARVALTVLVFDRARSALLTAVTYAVTIIPVFAGGILLSGLADRLPRRTVMIGCDAARAALALVIPGIPPAWLVVLLFAVTLFTAPFTLARAALYPDILAGDRYVLGTAITMTAFQAAQAAGFAVGGALTGLLDDRPGLLAEELLAERGITAGHVRVYRWVQRFTPELIEAARPCRHAPGDRWFAGETYLKVAGTWT